MKKPIYNCQDRKEIREIDCTLTAFKKLNLALLHLLRDFENNFKNMYQFISTKKE